MNKLARIVVDLPNHWAEHRRELLWARKLGDELYEIEAIPFLAYGLNYRDVVRARPGDEGGAPIVDAVVRRSGHTTLRVVFRRAEETRERRIALLSELGPLRVSFECWGEAFFALDVAPDGDVDAVIDRLELLEKNDVLGFETCEARVRGSFDHEDDPSLWTR